MWYPNRQQWWVIWGVYVAAVFVFFVSVDWLSRTEQERPPTIEESIHAAERALQLRDALDQTRDLVQKSRLDSEMSRLQNAKYFIHVDKFAPSIPPANLVTFLVIGGALAVWQLQRRI